jgi:hypothetical protein
MLVPSAFWLFQTGYSFEEMFGGEFRCYAKLLSIAIGNSSDN